MEPDPLGDEAFSGRLPLFPLPNVILFPHGLLPLHVFEPRYRALTEAALEGERLIGMAVLRPGWEPDYQGNPPVHDVVGMGRIVKEERLADGRWNLLLVGLARARVIEEVQAAPFRVARVDVLEDRPAEGDAYERRRRVLHAFYTQKLREAVPPGEPAPELPEDIPLGDLCDLVTSGFVTEHEERLIFLGERDVAARCDRLMEFFKNIPPSTRPRSWPPGNSAN
ncbi:MAG TPA: LON peptidase substrate-binding domain-containing protein [Planctomycetota bacterium]